MANLPSEIILNIMSRMPVKSLARFRCVSKLWCEYIDDQHLKIIRGQQYPEETAIMIARTNVSDHPLISLYAIESKKSMVLMKKIPSLEFKSTKISSEYNVPYILGSCNGLVYLSLSVKGYWSWIVHTCDIRVVDPLRKEYYELPPMNHPLDQKGIAFYGLGFDDSTNTFKMVFFTIVNEREEACAMVHVFGTRSWQQISQISLNLMIFTRPPNFPKAVFACGCLHWLDGYGKIISLDMRTEEFGLIDLPNVQRHGAEHVRSGLVDLHGEVGYVYCRFLSSLEVWVFVKRFLGWTLHWALLLLDAKGLCHQCWARIEGPDLFRGIQKLVWVLVLRSDSGFDIMFVTVLKQREWVIHFRFDHKPPLPAYTSIVVIGCWNRDGDIVMETITKGVRTQLFVYCRESDLLKEIKFIRKSKDFWFSNPFMYPSSLSSIHGIKAYSINN
ncbi:putative F-box domain, leucine-rich repeat domain superfamily, F-box-like domain superfamily [Helianthus anomalus]